MLNGKSEGQVTLQSSSYTCNKELKTCSFKHLNWKWMQLHNASQIFPYQKRGFRQAVKIEGIQTTISVQGETAETELMNRLVVKSKTDQP